MKQPLLGLWLAGLLLAGPVRAQAQITTTPGAATGAAGMGVLQSTGEVASVVDHTLTFTSDELGTRAVIVPDTAAISRDGQTVTLGDLEEGDAITIVQDGTGAVLSVTAEAVGPLAVNGTEIPLPVILLGGALLLLLLSYFWQRANQGKIKTASGRVRKEGYASER